MKKIFLSLVLALGITSNASAVMGGVLGNPVLYYAGCISANAAVVYTVKGLFTGKGSDFARAAKLGAIGLILLDNEGSMEFDRIDGHLNGVTQADLDIYNSEVEQLNIVAEEVASAFEDDTTLEESNALWNNFSQSLSPETMKVARAIIQK